VNHVVSPPAQGTAVRKLRTSLNIYEAIEAFEESKWLARAAIVRAYREKREYEQAEKTLEDIEKK